VPLLCHKRHRKWHYASLLNTLAVAPAAPAASEDTPAIASKHNP
jgi:hypothetical protein